MNIPIWNGSSTFVTGSTAFGFYDTDAIFQVDADKFARYAAIRLGYPIVDIELQSGSFYEALEEAVTTYGNEVYKYKIRENYLTLEGNSTGSILNDQLITPGLGSLIRIAKNYGSEVGTGGNINWYSGSIPTQEGVQVYDLNSWASSSASLSANDSIEIKRIFWEASPAIIRYFDPYANTGTGLTGMLDAFGMSNMSPAVNFMLMPISFDVAKIQAIEFNDQIRKSAFSFELINNQLRVFPIPKRDGRMHFQYIKVSERDDVTKGTTSGIITNYSNVPYQNPTYSNINALGRQWIFLYALAISKEILGYVRGKYNTVPIPNSEVTLNHAELVSAAKDEKEKLLTNLRETLEETSRTKQLEKQKNENEYLKDALAMVPPFIFVG